MKTLHVFSLLLCFAVLSCTKTNNISPDSTTNYLGDADYYALIVGKWQLVEVGTGESSVCQGGHIHIATSWTKTTNSDLLDFKTIGTFTKEMNNEELCKGSFRITNGRLITTSSCITEEDITDLTDKILILDTQNHLTRYKYVKM